MREKAEYVCALDLGKSQDFSAFVAAEVRRETVHGVPTANPPRVHVRHAERFTLGTSYPAVVREVCKLMRHETLKGAPLVVDRTGCGEAVVDLLRLAEPPLELVPVLITSGHAVTSFSDGSWHVAKSALVSSVQVLLQSRKLAWPRTDPTCQVLMKELSNFQIKITDKANETFGCWREGTHDDLVLAVALLCWQATWPVPESQIF